MLYLFALAITIALLIALFLPGVSASADPEIQGFRRGLKLVGVPVCLVFILLLTGACAVHAVDAGHVGVVRTFGKITNQTGAGLVVTLPWQNLDPASIQIQKYEDRYVAAASKETQDVAVNVTVNYQVSPIAIQDLYTRVGEQYQDVLIPSRVNNFVKEEVVKYNAVDVIPNREQIRGAIRDRLREELAPYSITVTDLLINNISFDAAFTKAIESKQVATQDAQAEANKVAVTQAQAQQRIEQAKGDAQAIATVQQALSQSPQYISYLEAQKFSQSWDGKLPMVVGAGEPLITVPSTQAPAPGK